VSAPKTKHVSSVPVVQIGRSILILRDQRVILDAELAGIYASRPAGLKFEAPCSR